jgi:hypothetical protein
VPKSSKNKHETRRANRDRRQRLEDLRKQQRAAERRKNFIFAGSAIAIAIVLIAVVVIPTWLHDRAEGKKDDPGYQAKPTSAEKAAGCLGVHNDDVSPAGDHVTDPIDYRTKKYGDTAGGTEPIPPSGGAHNPVPLPDSPRFFTIESGARAERAVHNLEHGYVVGWYDSKLPAAEVEKLRALGSDPTLPRLLLVPWLDGELPSDKHFVLTSWARTDRCETVSEDVVKTFFADHVNTLAPEATAGAGPPGPVDQLVGSPAPSASASASTSTSPSPSNSPKKQQKQ